MKKSFKRLLAAFFAVLFGFGSLTGCAKPAGPAGGDPPAPPPPATETDASGSRTPARQRPGRGTVDMSGFSFIPPEIPSREIEPEVRPDEIVTQELSSVSDTFFLIDENRSHGSERIMTVNGSWRRRSFVRFDLTGRPQTTARAVLRLTLAAVMPGYRKGTRTVSVYSVSDDWQETDTAEPAPDRLVTSFEVTKETETVFEADVTAFLKDFTGDSVSFAFTNEDGASDGKNGVDFYAREAGADKAPKLLITNYATSIEPTGLKTAANSMTVAVGTGKRIDCSLTPFYAYPRAYLWESADESVATVSDGNVRGVRAGSTTVTVSCGSLRRSVSVTVAASQTYDEALSPAADSYTYYKKADGFTESAPTAAASPVLKVAQKMNSAAETDEYGKAFLRFDSGAFPTASFAAAELILTVESVSVKETPLVAAYLLGDTDADALEYDTESTCGDYIGTFSLAGVQAGDTVRLDLTRFLNENSRKISDGLTIRLQFADVSTGSLNSVRFVSKEGGAARPVLRLVAADTERAVAEAEKAIAAIGSYDSVTGQNFGLLVAAEEGYSVLTPEQKRLLPAEKTELLQKARYYYDRRTAQDGKVVAYPVPENYLPSITDDYKNRYTVKANGTPVSLYPAETTYGGNAGAVGCYGLFDFSGLVSVEITTNFDFEEAVVRPRSAGSRAERVGKRTVRFQVAAPGNLSVEFDKDLTRNLELFSNEIADFSAYAESETRHVTRLETGKHSVSEILGGFAPKKTNVLRFTPGIHTLDDTLYLPSDTVCIIEGGAVVEGRIHVKEAHNVKILSRGVVNGTKLSRSYAPIGGAPNDGPDSYFMRLLKCTDVEIDGLVLQDSPHWTFVPIECENVWVNGLRIVGQKRPNNDGMDLVNSRGVTVHNSFIRTIDDGITIKGKYLSAERGKVADITVQNTVFWNYGAGQAIQVGAETCADEYENVFFRNVDIVHNLWQKAISADNMDSAVYKNVVFDDIRIEDDETNPKDQRGTLLGVSIADGYYSSDVERGRIESMLFNRIDYDGAYLDRGIYVKGLDENHRVSGVGFYRFRTNGELLTDASAVRTNAYVDPIEVSPNAYPFGANADRSGLFYEAESVFGKFADSKTDAAFSGKAYAEKAMNYGEAVTITFRVPQSGHFIPKVNLVKSLKGGIFAISVDGRDTGVRADTYSAAGDQQELALPCAYFAAGEHSVTLTFGEANPLSRGTVLGVDYFRMVPSDGDSVEAEDLKSNAAATADGRASGGYSVEAEKEAGETLVLTGRNSAERAGTPRVRLLTGPEMPRIKVRVNGCDTGGTIDLYDETEQYREFDLDAVPLTEGTLRFELTVVGKNDASSGFRLCVDRFRFIPAARSVIWRATRLGWKSASDGLTVAKSANDVNGYVYTTMRQTGQFIEFFCDAPFTGYYRIVPLLRTGPDQGVFDVYVNGEAVNTLDLYSSSARNADIMVSEQALGLTNTVKFVARGKNAFSSDMGIAVFDVKLIPAVVDKSRLAEAVKTEYGVLASAYTANSYAAYSGALAAAKSVLSNLKTTETDVIREYNRLTNAYENLRPQAFSEAEATAVAMPQTLLLSAGGRSVVGRAEPAGGAVIYSSSNVDVAVVNYKGEVRAVRDGNAVVTAKASDGREFGQTTVTVSTRYRVALTKAKAVFGSFRFVGARSGDSVTVQAYLRGVKTGELQMTLDETLTVPATLAQLNIESDGEYEFTFAVTRKGVPVFGAALGSGVFYGKETDLLSGEWLLNADITMTPDDGGITFGRENMPADQWYGVAVQSFALRTASHPFLSVRVDSVEGLFALKLIRQGGENEITLIGDTSATGAYLFDLTEYADESGTYDLRLYCVKKSAGEQNARVRVSELFLLGQDEFLQPGD